MVSTLITGTSSGIGFATAASLARAGYDVVATMRHPDRSPDLAELAAREGWPITILPLDVDSDESVSLAFAEAERQKGHIDVLVNNAGVSSTDPIEEGTLEHFRDTMETNFFGALRCIMVLPRMRERRSGTIINITSMAGRIASTPQAAYCASKFALEAASEILAQEVSPFDIRVAIVEPGIIATPIFDKLKGVEDSPYPGRKRLNALCVASLQDPVEPEVVAERILEILGSDDPPLRHLVGPGAEPFVAWREALSDEEFVAIAKLDDEGWAARIEQDFGLDVRPFYGSKPSALRDST